MKTTRVAYTMHAPKPAPRLHQFGVMLGLCAAMAWPNLAVQAQTAAPASPAQTMPATVPGTLVLPEALQRLGMTDVRYFEDRDDHETYIHARLPSGGWLRAELNRGRLVEVQSSGTALPTDLVSALLPATVLQHTSLRDMATLTKIDLDDHDIELEGLASNGMRMEIEFTPAGGLTKLEIEQDDRRSLSEATARQRLAALGYQSVGYVERGGRYVEAVAQNPYGEWVEVRLDERGEVDRERRWSR